MHDLHDVNWSGLAFLTLAIVWFPAYGVGSVLLRWHRRRVVREAKLLLMPAAMYPHRCRIDLHGSDVRVEEGGGIVAQCSVPGCTAAVEIAPNMRAVTVQEPQQPRTCAAIPEEWRGISYSDDHTG